MKGMDILQNVHITISNVETVKLKYKLVHKIHENVWFFRFHFMIVIASFVLPGLLTYYLNDNMEQINKLTNYVTIPLALFHSLINFVLVLDGMNPPEPSSFRYILFWIIYEFAKVLLIIISLSSSEVQNAQFKLPYAVLTFLIIEGMQFFITEFRTPRLLWETVTKRVNRIAWPVFTLLLVTYCYAFIGVYLFNNVVSNAVTVDKNTFIEGSEFSNIMNARITLLDFQDWFNAYLLRAIQIKMPGAIIYFLSYFFFSRYILANLIIAEIVDWFRSDSVATPLMFSAPTTASPV